MIRSTCLLCSRSLSSMDKRMGFTECVACRMKENFDARQGKKAPIESRVAALEAKVADLEARLRTKGPMWE